MSAVKYLWPVNRLRELVTQPGGKTRSAALADVAACLAENRAGATEGMSESLDAIEAILDEANRADLDRAQVYSILQHTERLANIATAFDMQVVLRVIASQGELGMSLLDAPARPWGPFAVHLRAARWAVENAHLSEAEAEPILGGLLKVAAKFDAGAQARTG